MRMSGGERQRIALARAFLKDAPILVLDEPTSSVDVKTEAAIMEAMGRLMEGRTTFMIAHRLSTLDVCDTFVHVEDGTALQVDRSAVGSLSLESALVGGGHETHGAEGSPGAAGLSRVSPSSPGSTGHADVFVSSVGEAIERVTGQRAGFVDRRPDPYDTPGRTELLDWQVGDEQWQVRAVFHADDRGRGGEPYAAHVLRRVVSAGRLPALTYLDTLTVPGGAWVLARQPADAWRLSELATVEAMESATRWLATFHRLHEFTLARDMPDLRRFRLDDYVGWARRAESAAAASDTGWLAGVCRRFAETADFLLEPPLTAILDNAYPGNLLVAEGRVYPVDLGDAAVGAGELDLGELLDGWPTEVVERCRRLYRRVRWPDGPAELHEVRLDLARAALHLRWLGNGTSRTEASWRLEDLHAVAGRIGLR